MRASDGNLIDLSGEDDQQLLLKHLYAHLVHFTERKIRNAVRQDHALKGCDYEDDSALKEIRYGRIAVVAGLCELVNFWHLWADSTDETTNAKLVQSGASLLASTITISMTPFYGTLPSSLATMGWKIAGSVLSAIRSFASAWLDRIDVVKKVQGAQYEVAFFLAMKTTLDVGAGAAFLVDGISTAAPMLKAVATRSGNRIVMLARRTCVRYGKGKRFAHGGSRCHEI